MNHDPGKDQSTALTPPEEAMTLRVVPPVRGEGGPEQPGDHIGRYELLEILGEGGFGSVWRASQSEPIHREVALKVIKPGMDSREIIRRFEAERQTLALMEHPHIAGVLDAGTTANGRPFFVMELVKGEPITEYCDKRQLTVRQRLELFIPVCMAVQHAHQKAVLHRDLKPSNILVTEVDGKSLPKVIDFGIAKALGTAPEAVLRANLLQTQAGVVIGTPQYMSPEQAGAHADMDTRSDIYTLGVILFELLTGDTPLSRESLRQAALDEVLRLVREAQPKRPSSRLLPVTEAARQTSTARHTEPARLSRALKGDLDWITLKALEKERERRYGSAAALAQDLENFLQDRPVAAGPPGRLYLMRKFVARNRTLVAAAALLALSLITGAAVSTSLFFKEKDARLDAVRARGAAEQLVNDVIFDLRDKLRPLGRLELLDKAASSAKTYLETVPPGEAGPKTEKQRGAMLLNLGEIFRFQGKNNSASQCYEEAHAILRQLADAQPESREAKRDLAVADEKLGDMAMARLEFQKALDHYSRSLPVWEAFHAENPAERDHLLTLSIGSTLKAQAHAKLGQQEDAHRLYERNAELLKPLLPEKNLPFALKRELALSLSHLGDVHNARGNLPEAEKNQLAAITLLNELYQTRRDNAPLLRDLAVHMSRLGFVQLKRGNPGEARKNCEQALLMTQALVKHDSRNALWNHDEAELRHQLSIIAEAEGRFADAETQQVHACKRLQEIADDDPSNTEWQLNAAQAWRQLADVREHRGNHAGMEEAARKALAVQLKLHERRPDSTLLAKNLVLAYEQLGKAQVGQLHSKEAAAAFTEALRFLDQALKSEPDSPELRRNSSILRLHLGDAQELALDYKAAEQSYREALEMAEKRASVASNKSQHLMDIAGMVERLSSVILEQGQHDEALKFARQSVEIRRQLLSTAPKQRDYRLGLAIALQREAEALVKLGRHEPAVATVREVMSVLAAVLRDQPEDEEARSMLARENLCLGEIYQEQKNVKEAEPLFREFREFNRALLEQRPDDPALRHDEIVCLKNLAWCALLREDNTNGRSLLEQAVEKLGQLRKLHGDTPEYQAADAELRQSLKLIGQP